MHQRYIVNILKTRFRWLVIAAAAVSIAVFAAGLVLFRVYRAESASAIEVENDSKFSFVEAPVNPVTASGMEPITTPAALRDVSVFKDRLYVSGPSGLMVYDNNGTLLHRYRVGLELPAAELGAMSTGVSGGARQPELFIATHGAGVLAFDGQRFRAIRPSSAPLANTTAVLALSTGRLLIGTEHGLLACDGRTLAPFHSGLNDAYITALAGVEGDLWIGTLHDGLFHYHAGELDRLKDSLPDPQVLSLALHDGIAYAGTPLGVVEFKDGRRTRLLADGYFAVALAADERCLSVGTEDEGIAGVPLAPHGCEARPQSFTGASIRRLAIIGDSQYALTESGLFRLDTSSGQWRHAVNADAGALTNRNISALAVGRGGRLWVGYFDSGLDILEPDLEHVTHREDDHLFCINRIVPELAGDRVAVATANGLAMFDSTSQVRQVLGRKDGLLADHVTDVIFRPHGMVVATPAGLSFVDSTGVRSLYAFHGLVNNHVYALASSGGRTLVGTLGGISSVENDTVRVNYDTSNSGLKHNWITAVVFAGGDWFAGTYGAGVFRLDSNSRWSAFADLKGGVIVNPNAMVATPSRIYAGSLGRGLFVYDRASGRWSNITKGLPSLNVTALAEANGRLYIGTDNGLVRAEEGSLL